MSQKKELHIGDKASFTKNISSQDIYTYAEVSGDDNPVHIDDEYAKQSFFGERIAHGYHVGSLISATIGKYLPGNGTIYLSQTMNFKSPVKVNDTITAMVEVIDFPKNKHVLLKTSCINQHGVIVILGEALVIPPQNIKLVI
jgi:3-hydroxybutyryl-CoA dehydratase